MSEKSEPHSKLAADNPYYHKSYFKEKTQMDMSTEANTNVLFFQRKGY